MARLPGASRPHLVVAFEDDVVDLAVLRRTGLVGGGIDPSVFCATHLNALLEQGPEAWRAVRGDLREVLLDPGGLPAGALVPLGQSQLGLPVAVGDFVDGYGGLHHATNMGRILRPDGPPLLPNWRHLPVGYHGRTATVVAVRHAHRATARAGHGSGCAETRRDRTP